MYSTALWPSLVCLCSLLSAGLCSARPSLLAETRREGLRAAAAETAFSRSLSDGRLGRRETEGEAHGFLLPQDWDAVGTERPHLALGSWFPGPLRFGTGVSSTTMEPGWTWTL